MSEIVYLSVPNQIINLIEAKASIHYCYYSNFYPPFKIRLFTLKQFPHIHTVFYRLSSTNFNHISAAISIFIKECSHVQICKPLQLIRFIYIPIKRQSIHYEGSSTNFKIIHDTTNNTKCLTSNLYASIIKPNWNLLQNIEWS